MPNKPRHYPSDHPAPNSRAATHCPRLLLAGAAALAQALAPPAVSARADPPHDPHIAIEDPRLLPFLPVLEQCVERRGQYATAVEFFRTDYGVACAAVLLSFQLVTSEELAEAWTR